MDEPFETLRHRNPRENPHHRERGGVCHLKVTYEVVARSAWLKVDTVRRHARSKRVDMSDMDSVVDFIVKHRAKRAKKEKR